MKPMSGAELVARLQNLEAFVKVLVHGVAKRHPEMKDELLEALKVQAQESMKGFGRMDVVGHAENHTDEFLNGIRQAIEEQ